MQVLGYLLAMLVLVLCIAVLAIIGFGLCVVVLSPHFPPYFVFGVGMMGLAAGFIVGAVVGIWYFLRITRWFTVRSDRVLSCCPKTSTANKPCEEPKLNQDRVSEDQPKTEKAGN